MTWHARAGGTWRTITGAHVRVSGVWQPVQQGWVRVSGVWQQFYTSESLVIPTSLSGSSVVAYDPIFFPSSNVAFSLRTDGTYQITNDSGVQSSGNWISPTSAASNYEAIVTHSSSGGSVSGSTFGSYQALSSNRTWQFTNTTPTSVGTSTFSFTIRRVGSGTPTISGAVDMTCDLS